MAASGFCTTCTKIVYYIEEDEAHCPVCSSPLVGREAEAVVDE